MKGCNRIDLLRRNRAYPGIRLRKGVSSVAKDQAPDLEGRALHVTPSPQPCGGIFAAHES